MEMRPSGAPDVAPGKRVIQMLSGGGHPVASGDRGPGGEGGGHVPSARSGRGIPDLSPEDGRFAPGAGAFRR